VDPVHALWIGGATGSGKTSISRALAYRRDLQLYNVDHRTFDHLARARVPPEIRWDLPPPVLADHFFEYSRNRFELVLEDLAALPPSPGAIAEGPFLLPSLVPAGAAAVFLVPGEERIRATGAERGQREVVVERNLLLAERIAAEADAAGLPVLAVDGELEEMTARVEGLLAPEIARLPRGGDLAAVRRFENDALAEQVRLYRSSGEAPPGSPPLAFACECGRSGCAEEVELTLEDYLRVSAGADRSPLRRPRS
jgi:hypothetical protein